MTTPSTGITRRITSRIQTVLEQRHGSRALMVRDISPDTELRELGLDSLASVNLMLAIEAEFDIFIPQSDMVPQNFRTISAIAAVVTGLAMAA